LMPETISAGLRSLSRWLIAMYEQSDGVPSMAKRR
jgi:hypothetical protein